jgi:hypothetical protein
MKKRGCPTLDSLFLCIIEKENFGKVSNFAKVEKSASSFKRPIFCKGRQK